MIDLAKIKPPSATYFLLFLLCYIVAVGPVNYVVLRLIRKPELAWITIPGVVVVFTGVSVTVAQMSRGTSSVAVDASLVEVYQPEGLGRATGGLLVMPTSKGTQELFFRGRDTYVTDVNVAGADALEVERNPEGIALRAGMNKWSQRVFQTVSASDGVSPLVAVITSGSATRVKNLGDAAITRAVLVNRAGISDVVDLQPGEEKQVQLTKPADNMFVAWYETQLGQQNEEAELFSQLRPTLDGEVGKLDPDQGFFNSVAMPAAIKSLRRPMLICFAEKSPLVFDSPASTKRRSKALYVIHL